MGEFDTNPDSDDFRKTMASKSGSLQIQEMISHFNGASEYTLPSLKKELRDYVYSSKDDEFIRNFLEEKGLPYTNEKEELIERLLYCICDEEDVSSKMILQHTE